MRRIGAVGAAAVALLACTWLFSREYGGGAATPVRPGQSGQGVTILGGITGRQQWGGAVRPGKGLMPLAPTNGMTLPAGTGLLAPPDSDIRIGTSDGTVLTLDKSAELIVGEQTEIRRYSLVRGAVLAHVAKQPPGRRFIVNTEDAEVEVHGTVFRVAVVRPNPSCADGIRTRVSVSEGVVSVRSRATETFVAAGEVWPANCPPDEASPEASGGASSDHDSSGAAPHRDRRAAASAVRVVPRGASTPGWAGVTPPPTVVRDTSGAVPRTHDRAGISALQRQNDLFAAALRAKRQGRIDQSVQLFSRLVDSYPNGPLAEGAMAQRMRVQATDDGLAAKRAASEYLRRFPNGFARDEALRLADMSP